MNKEFIHAIEDIEKEKRISKEYYEIGRASCRERV